MFQLLLSSCDICLFAKRRSQDTDVRYRSTFLSAMPKNRRRKQIKIRTNWIFWGCACLSCCWCHLEILEVGQGHFPHNGIIETLWQDSVTQTATPLAPVRSKIKSNASFKTGWSSVPALGNYSLDRGKGRRADGCITSMCLWCKTTTNWISCKCLLTFWEVALLYLRKGCFAVVQRKYFCPYPSCGSAEQKRNLWKQCLLLKVCCLLLNAQNLNKCSEALHVNESWPQIKLDISWICPPTMKFGFYLMC